MSAYRSGAPAALTDNFFSRIGEDWMLITAQSSQGEVNTMTASWGCAGILWNKPVAVCFIRPQRYTYGIVEEDFISAELEAVPAYCARDVGFDRSFISAYGHDDRVCAYAELAALFALDKPARTAVCIFADKEEIGSVGATGMDSTFFENSIAEIASRVLGKEYSDLAVRRILEASRMISADVTAAADPLYAGSDAPGNTALMNAGACINKYTGGRGKGGANDARAEFLGELRAIFAKHNVAWQIGELGKVDFGGGGTVAKYIANHNIETVDLGVPVIAMHAPYEVVAKVDVYETFRAFSAFYKH